MRARMEAGRGGGTARCRWLAALSACTLLIAGCQAAPMRPASAIVAATGEEWRREALPAHSNVTADIPPLFRQLAAARPAGGVRNRAAANRVLLDPDLLLPSAAPSPGAYRCRMVRLGTASSGRASATSRDAYCFVGTDGQRLGLTLETPARRLGGYLWATSDPRQLVFLGAEFAPRARAAPPYGDPPSASTAGLFQRIGDFRYRLIVRGSAPGTIDVYELIAAPGPV